MPERIAVVGVVEPLTKDAMRAVEDADLVVGAPRHLAAVGRDGVPLAGDVDGVLDRIAMEPGRVCVLASGDPGFFGIVRPLARRFGRHNLDVHPAASSVAIAFARLGLPWDDAVVVSAHGRPLADAVDVARRNSKVAVLVSPDNPPQAVGRLLLDRGARHTTAAVCSWLGTPDEQVVETDLRGLAGGDWDPLSVVLLIDGDGVGVDKTLVFGQPDAGFAHRAGMITKAEVRALVIAKLALPEHGVLWDVGAGSGSVAVECAAVAPGLDVYAIDPDTAHLRENVAGTSVRIVEGRAPDALTDLPDPDRVFVGGGGLGVLDDVLARLRPGGCVVAAYAAIDRACAAAERLGHLVQASVSRGTRLPDGGLRLAAENPVFIAWGPDE